MTAYIPHPSGHGASAAASRSLAFHFLGQIDLEVAMALQRRLVYEVSSPANLQASILLCEHPPKISIGRSGSRGDIRLSNAELRRRRLDLCYVGRGGGCILHGPGQLAVYPIVPLSDFGWSVGDYLRRLQSGFAGALKELRAPCHQHAGRFGLWGRSGQLVVVGAAVRNNVAWQGAFVSVNPPGGARGYVDLAGANEHDKNPLGSLVSETGRRITMPMIRSMVVSHLSAALDVPRHHLHTGHPLLAACADYVRRATACAS